VCQRCEWQEWLYVLDKELIPAASFPKVSRQQLDWNELSRFSSSVLGYAHITSEEIEWVKQMQARLISIRLLETA
jgi:hypothetical protein